MEYLYTPELYLPEKYKVHIGTHTHLGLCTSWTDPVNLIQKYPEVVKEFALIGTLYSREGVSILIRNLCLNPSIRHVVLWAHDPLSKTAIGRAGKELLLAVWEHGVGEEGIIKNTSEKVHKEIDQKIVEKVIANVQVHDLSDLTFEEMMEKARCLENPKEKEYMSPISFPEPKREKMSKMPSEGVNFSIRGRYITDAWARTVDRIMRYGTLKKTEYGGSQKELQLVNWTIIEEDIQNLHTPEWPDSLKKVIGLDSEMLSQYKDIFLNAKKPEGTSYTYGNRLNNYLGKTNQIHEIITKLKEHAYTRRAYATTFYPPEDLFQKSPPCLTQIQLLSEETGHINLFATFRSHDIFKAAIPNAFGLHHLLNFIAHETNLKKGKVTICSISAHIYEEDFQNATDLMKCSLWAKPKLYFDEHEDIDPRGIVRIQLKENCISLELMDTNGMVLWDALVRSAREGAMLLARLSLLSKNEHYVDITIELTKAELCMKLGKEYIQDKPLILEKAVIK
jgi:thymidylate synthase